MLAFVVSGVCLVFAVALVVSWWRAREEDRIDEAVRRSAWRHFVRLRSEEKI